MTLGLAAQTLSQHTAHSKGKRGESGEEAFSGEAMQTPHVLLREDRAMGSATEAEGLHCLCVTSMGPIPPLPPRPDRDQGNASREEPHRA